MKEKEIKEIVQRSKVETSADFTDRLMLQIEKNSAEKPVPNPVFYVVLSLLAVISVGISYVLFKNYGSTFIFAPLNFQVSGKFLFLAATILLFFVMNYWLRLRDTYDFIQKKEKIR